MRENACIRSIGSPPRERGQDCVEHLRVDRFRFTPARAGTGRRGVRVLARATVHPRASGDRPPEELSPAVCAGSPRASGDRPNFFLPDARKSGSPPRERGQVIEWRVASRICRFTPARAGTGSHRRSKLNPVGSPPRERGQGHTLLVRQVNARFTPARAGTGRVSACSAHSAPVHPRASGDRPYGNRDSRRSIGSPPRERGQGTTTAGWMPISGSPPRERGQVHCLDRRRFV